MIAFTLWSAWRSSLAGQLFPHLPNKGNPIWELVVPLWVEGHGGYLLWGISPGSGVLAGAWHRVVILLPVVLALFMLRRLHGPARKDKAAIVVGVLLALAIGAVEASLPSSLFADEDLKIYRQIWEPR